MSATNAEGRCGSATSVEATTAAVCASGEVDVWDFFCGCGGTSAGLAAAGMTILGGLDLDAESAATYRFNFPQAAFIEQDIRDVSPARVSDITTRSPGSRLLVSACAPCQPYTNFHRKSSSRAEQRTLLLRLLPFIDELNPDFVFVENVPGLHKVQGSEHVQPVRLGAKATWVQRRMEDRRLPRVRSSSAPTAARHAG